MKLLSKLSLLLASILLVAACDPGDSRRDDDSSAQSNSTAGDAGMADTNEAVDACSNCGTVRSISPVTAEGDSSGAGAAVGAVVGGLLGSQVGGGSGKDVATAVGAVGGAVAGNEVEKRKKSVTYYEVTVEMDSGGRQVVNVGSAQGISVGTQVEVMGNDLRVR